MRAPIEKGPEVTAPSATPIATKPSRIHVVWAGEHKFDAGRPDKPDGPHRRRWKTAQTPPERC